MKRRSFLRSGTAALGVPFGLAAMEAFGASAAATTERGSFAIDANQVRFYSDEFSKPIRVLIVADTHLFTDDGRGKPFQQFSGRMAGAYNETQHFQTDEAPSMGSEG